MSVKTTKMATAAVLVCFCLCKHCLETEVKNDWPINWWPAQCHWL